MASIQEINRKFQNFDPKTHSIDANLNPIPKFSGRTVQLVGDETNPELVSVVEICVSSASNYLNDPSTNTSEDLRRLRDTFEKLKEIVNTNQGASALRVECILDVLRGIPSDKAISPEEESLIAGLPKGNSWEEWHDFMEPLTPENFISFVQVCFETKNFHLLAELLSYTEFYPDLVQTFFSAFPIKELKLKEIPTRVLMELLTLQLYHVPHSDVELCALLVHAINFVGSGYCPDIEKALICLVKSHHASAERLLTRYLAYVNETKKWQSGNLHLFLELGVALLQWPVANGEMHIENFCNIYEKRGWNNDSFSHLRSADVDLLQILLDAESPFAQRMLTILFEKMKHHRPELAQHLVEDKKKQETLRRLSDLKSALGQGDFNYRVSDVWGKI